MKEKKNVGYHIPALLERSLAALEIRKDGIYVDATFGGGGHSREILKKLSKKGKLVAFDKDADALANIPENDNLLLVNNDFVHLKNFLRYFGIESVDGILADLGVSSHQFDTPERGFSFRFDAALDMRMDKENQVTAAGLLNEKSPDELQKIFSEYGEVRNAKTLAQAIVNYRRKKAIKTTGHLVEIAESVLPARENIRKYMAPVFQALRIAVNDEMEGLKSFLKQTLEVLKPGGRLAVITYHSLEDRPVKNFMQFGNFEKKAEKDIYGNVVAPLREIGRKPLVPSEEEIENNPRVRSAKLRVAEKMKVEK